MRRTVSLDRDWIFQKESRVTLPHCVAKLSWQNWNPADWEQVWTYERRFDLPHEFQGSRIFLHFDEAMVTAAPVINGHALPSHAGGFLPFEYEITDWVKPQENVLTVAVDSRWQSVPPEGSPKGPASIDYLLHGGMTGSMSLRAVPRICIRDVFAKPVDVLDSSKRRVEVLCTIDGGQAAMQPVHVTAQLVDGARVVAESSKEATTEQVALTLGDLSNVNLWDVERPHLYQVAVSLSSGDEVRTRIGFREARFDVDGFFLNGKRFKLFGLNRHELYPYVGRAMPRRVLRKDAEILRREFNCNMVRCSHYPQSEAFLDACDELGLMVWEETPGWQYLGDEQWKDLVVRDVEQMVRRDRNHSSIIIWGVRVNESHNDPALYTRTKQAAKALDDSRPTSGSMVYYSTKDWLQDVFAFDDYHATPDGNVALRPPLAGVPFFFSEAVGQFNYPARHGFDVKYRRAGELEVQERQALFHAQVHEKSAANERYAGVTALCAFDYGSVINAYAGVKSPGVADVFRIPKLGAGIYRSQVDPRVRAVIEPNFYWDFGPRSPTGPGPEVTIFSNCERLEWSINGQTRATVYPDRFGFPHLKYPPFFVNVRLQGEQAPELRIDGYVGTERVISRSFSADPHSDRLLVEADDPELMADGSDATRVVFRAVDKFGAARPFVDGAVDLKIEGPGTIVGDNPFELADAGGVGAVWVKANAGGAGKIQVTASHAKLGQGAVTISLVSAASKG